MRAVSRCEEVSFAGALAVDLIERALDDVLGAPAGDLAWSRLVRAVDWLLAVSFIGRVSPAGLRLDRFVAENADVGNAPSIP